MYYYILEKAKEAEFAKIESKLKEILTNYDILGEFVFLETLADAEEATKNALNKNFSTIVAVGGDELANHIAPHLVETKAALGIMPLEEGLLSIALGLGNWKNAAEILAARRLLLTDTGVINDKKFVTNLFSNNNPDSPPEIKPRSIISKLLGTGTVKNTTEQPENAITVSVEEDFQIDSPVTGLIISNIRPMGKDIESIRRSLIDNNIHLAFSDQVNSAQVYQSMHAGAKEMQTANISLFHLNQFEIRSEKPIFFWSGNQVIARTPASVSVLPQSLKIISGRLR